VAADSLRPPLNPLPAEQDWSFLANPLERRDLFDPAKYLAFGSSPQRYASFGLEFRTEHEWYDNWMFGAGPQSPHGYQLTRLMPHVDLHFGPDVRLFSEFKFDYEDGRAGGPRPQIDEDEGDVHQAFLEIGPHVSGPTGFSVRAGRQEVVFGSGRLFDNVDGPNVKLSFDGLRLIAATAHVRLDVFAVKPVNENPGFFDDNPIYQRTVWGAYVTGPAPLTARGQADAYYIGETVADASFARGTAGETRHTVGIRLFRPIGHGLDYNWEPNFQWGGFGGDAIRAWSVSTETGYTLDGVPLLPRPLVRIDAYSGDGNPTRRTLGTFDPLFARGAYFTNKLDPFLGPQNLVDVHPMLQFQPIPSLTGAISWAWYWRESTQDGIYAFGSDLLIDPPTTNRASYLGHQGDAEIRWAPVPHVILAFNVAGFSPGTFFETVAYHRAPFAANVGVTFRM
jgi:Alginate export